MSIRPVPGQQQRCAKHKGHRQDSHYLKWDRTVLSMAFLFLQNTICLSVHLPVTDDPVPPDGKTKYHQLSTEWDSYNPEWKMIPGGKA